MWLKFDISLFVLNGNDYLLQYLYIWQKIQSCYHELYLKRNVMIYQLTNRYHHPPPAGRQQGKGSHHSWPCDDGSIWKQMQGYRRALPGAGDTLYPNCGRISRWLAPSCFRAGPEVGLCPSSPYWTGGGRKSWPLVEDGLHPASEGTFCHAPEPDTWAPSSWSGWTVVDNYILLYYEPWSLLFTSIFMKSTIFRKIN